MVGSRHEKPVRHSIRNAMCHDHERRDTDTCNDVEGCNRTVHCSMLLCLSARHFRQVLRCDLRFLVAYDRVPVLCFLFPIRSNPSWNIALVQINAGRRPKPDAQRFGCLARLHIVSGAGL